MRFPDEPGNRGDHLPLTRQRMRIALLLVLMLPTLLGVSSCSSAIGGPAEGSDANPLLPSLQVSTQARDVTLILQVTNVGQVPLEAAFSTGQSYDFLVLQD